MTSCSQEVAQKGGGRSQDDISNFFFFKRRHRKSHAFLISTSHLDQRRFHLQLIYS